MKVRDSNILAWVWGTKEDELRIGRELRTLYKLD
jgi:hypothetical protein